MSAGGPCPRRWGWHRLDSRWAARVVAAADLGPDDLVLDLGAGTGALTLPLSDSGARVVAVELHPVRAEALRAAVAGRPVEVRSADMLTTPWPPRRFRVVANPPYALSAALIGRLTAARSAVIRADLVLPVAIAQRWLRRPPPGFRARRGLWLPADAFRPTATGDATVLVLQRLVLQRPVLQRPVLQRQGSRGGGRDRVRGGRRS